MFYKETVNRLSKQRLLTWYYLQFHGQKSDEACINVEAHPRTLDTRMMASIERCLCTFPTPALSFFTFSTAHYNYEDAHKDCYEIDEQICGMNNRITATLVNVV